MANGGVTQWKIPDNPRRIKDGDFVLIYRLQGNERCLLSVLKFQICDEWQVSIY